MQHLCAMGEKCRSDAETKLREYKLPEEDIQWVTDRLIEEKFH